MTPFAGLLNDKEVAAVLTYIKNSFGNNSGVVKPEQVKNIRAALGDDPNLLEASELLKKHPHK